MEELSNKERRGIDISIKALSKKYPFVKGWDLTKDWNRYNTMIGIDVYVNFFDLSDYSGLRMSPYWKKALLDPQPDERDLKTYALGGYFEYPREDQTMFELRRKLESTLEDLYVHLPDDMKTTYDFKSILAKDGDPPNKTPRRLTVDNFISTTQ
jgi:hypothetical protein